MKWNSLSYRKVGAGDWDSNPRRPAWEAGILPLNYSRLPLFSANYNVAHRAEHSLNAIVSANLSNSLTRASRPSTGDCV